MIDNNKEGLSAEKAAGSDDITALVLGGGGSRGAYQAGVWQALIELDVKYSIITGTSVGAINGAMFAQGEFETVQKLWSETETHMVLDVPENGTPLDYAKEIVLNRGAGTSGLKELLDKYVDEDKIRKSPVEFGLTVFAIHQLKGYYLFTEDIPIGKLKDYVMASGSCFPALHSYTVDGVEYIDGGYADLLPIDMALSKGATNIIAVNVHGPGRFRKDALERAPKLTLIEPSWDLGNFLIFDKDNSKRIMTLGYLDTLKAFGAADGNRFTFQNDSFSLIDTSLADSCAKIFEMDPTVLYTRDSFFDALKEKINSSYAESADTIKEYRNNPLWRLNFKDIKHIPDDVENVTNFESLAFLVALDIRDNKEDSIFIGRPALKIMPDIIKAARFIEKYNLI